MKAKAYRKRPATIEAIQLTDANIIDVGHWSAGRPIVEPDGSTVCLLIRTLEGEHRAYVGDWIIRGIKGEFYPCKDDIFRMTYEEL